MLEPHTDDNRTPVSRIAELSLSNPRDSTMRPAPAHMPPGVERAVSSTTLLPSFTGNGALESGCEGMLHYRPTHAEFLLSARAREIWSAPGERISVELLLQRVHFQDRAGLQKALGGRMRLSGTDMVVRVAWRARCRQIWMYFGGADPGNDAIRGWCVDVTPA